MKISATLLITLLSAALFASSAANGLEVRGDELTVPW